MADDNKTTTDDKTTTTTDDKKTGESAGLKVGDIRKMIGDMVAEAVKAGTSTHDDAQKGAQQHTETRLDRSSSVQVAVQAEIDKIRNKEAAEKKDKDLQDKLTELQEKTKEKAPVERRRVHKLMGWGENG